ncbi:hypothetical protein EV424DRAFT_1351817 [Suillus variegatus]|nr:hypothetical protein EV424DRAFT_1351817 [Suillus variegatus]
MSHPSNHPYPGKVQFETPMETNKSAYSSVAGMLLVNVSGPHELIFPTSAMDRTNSESGFNLGMSLPATQPSLTLRSNFGMDLDMPMAPSATPPTQRFNLGMNLSIPGAVPPSSPVLHTQQPFNLGFTLPQPTQQPAPKLFNLGFNLLVPSKATPLLTTSSQPFNFGFNLPFATPPATSSVPVPAQEDTLTTSSQPFNYDFNLPHATSPATRSKLVPGQAETSRHFGCEPPSPIGEWQPELIRVPQSTPPVASSPPAITDASPGPSMPRAFSLPTIEDATPGPSMPCALPHTGKHVEWPTVGSLVGDAKCVAIDILRCLGGEKFDHLAQMMVGGALGLGDDVWDPNPDEVLQSNKVMLLAFFETRDYPAVLCLAVPQALYYVTGMHAYIMFGSATAAPPVVIPKYAKLSKMMYVMQALFGRPKAKFDMDSDRSQVELRVHDLESGRCKQVTSVSWPPYHFPFILVLTCIWLALLYQLSIDQILGTIPVPHPPSLAPMCAVSVARPDPSCSWVMPMNFKPSQAFASVTHWYYTCICYGS